MKNTRAIVTLAVGDHAVEQWQRACEPSWRDYADRHGFDVVCLTNPLDSSAQARRRPLSWQKCLTLSQRPVREYERVVWIDPDILINAASAPDIVHGVPVEMVGAVEELTFSHTDPHLAREIQRRGSDLWLDRATRGEAAEQDSARDGLLQGCRVLNAGVLVLSPHHHRDLLEQVYYRCDEPRTDMRPLSHELVRADRVHWIDPRYNVAWSHAILLYYPFLLNPQRRPDAYTERSDTIQRSKPPADEVTAVRSLCANAAFQRSFFLHFGGPYTSDMHLLDSVSR